RITTRQEFRILRRLPQTRVEEPQKLAADTNTLFVRITDIDESGIGKSIQRGRRKSSLDARLAIGGPGALGAFHTTQNQRIHHAAPSQFGRGLRITGRSPHRRMRTLIAWRPDVHVAMGEMLTLPTERTIVAGQRL